MVGGVFWVGYIRIYFYVSTLYRPPLATGRGRPRHEFYHNWVCFVLLPILFLLMFLAST